MVIIAGVLLWLVPSEGTAGSVLTAVFKAGVLVWAADEIVRGVNPWRRCLGGAVAIYTFMTTMG
jgi:hypothetical protein